MNYDSQKRHRYHLFSKKKKKTKKELDEQTSMSACLSFRLAQPLQRRGRKFDESLQRRRILPARAEAGFMELIKYSLGGQTAK